jgi:hypothetical protein
MQPHVRNDVKPSIGRVVTSDWLDFDVGSISTVVEACVCEGCDNACFGDTEKALIFVLN